MLGIADYGAFCAAVLLFLALPGPGNLALLTSTGKGGLRAGLAATLGVIVGDQVLLWLAVAGVAALLAANPAVFAAVQYAGAAYLGWLGFKLIVAKGGAAAVVPISAGRYARQAFFITLLNPKAIVFYMAFFPLFIDPQAHQGALTFATMAATIAALTFGYGLVVCLFARALGEQIGKRQRLARALERIAGVFLIGFGVKLVAS